MLIHIPAMLTPEQAAACRRALDGAQWVDGRSSAGPVAARVKNNQEVPTSHPIAQQWGQAILGALGASPMFLATALPLRIAPPMFNRYQVGETYGTHNDAAFFNAPPPAPIVRADLAATLFLTPPGDYDGGELTVEDMFGTQRVKLPAGDLVLYPASSQHRVQPVTRGARVASFLWMQSMVRDDEKRALLVQMDRARASLGRAAPDDPGIVQLVGVYHNLVRMWAET
jgi:PKHD-type hydroxylase